MKASRKFVSRKIMLAILWIVFAVSLCIFAKLFIIDSLVNSKINNDIQDMYHADENNCTEEDYVKKFKDLSALNPDIIGWINFPNVGIDYPVLQSKGPDPKFYLYKDYNKKYSRYGSIFLDSDCSHDKDTKSMIIHGHSMRDGSMFGKILKYSDLDYYKSCPVINFDTEQQRCKWKIFSIFKTNVEKSQGPVFEYLVSDFGSIENFLEYMYQVRKRSLIETPVDVMDNDRIIILSTCSYEFKNFRTVIVARAVREGESSDVDVSLAKYASDPYMPLCWYKSKGKTQPVLKRFREELYDGNIDWYKNN